MSSNIELINPYEINSPVLEELTTKLTEIMKLEISQAILSESYPNKFTSVRSDAGPNEIKSSENNLGKVVVQQFNKKTPEAKKRIVESLKATLKTDVEVNEFARLSKIEITSAPIVSQLDLSKSFPLLSTEKGSKDLLKVMKKLGATKPTSVPGVTHRNLNKALKLKLHSVKCLDETDHILNLIESDEIHLSVVKSITDATDVVANFTKPFLVAANFENNVTKVYNPPQTIAQFILNSSNYPLSIFSAIALSEIDNGGFNQFLLHFVKGIEEKATEIINLIMAAAVAGAGTGAVTGAVAGATTGTAAAPGPGTGVGAAIGALIGVVTGIVLGGLGAWLGNELVDDSFPPQVTEILFFIYGDETYKGKLNSPKMDLYFSDHGGRYRVKYSWEIIR